MERLLDQATRDPVFAFILLLGVALVVAIVIKSITHAAHLQNTKVCDACKSRVPLGARKCAHCGETFAVAAQTTSAPASVRATDDDPPGFGG